MKERISPLVPLALILVVLFALRFYANNQNAGGINELPDDTVTVEENESQTQADISDEPKAEETAYTFRSKKLLNEHYEKHGREMGFSSAAQYEAAASAVINNSAALHKVEAEDGDDVYYIEETNEFVILSTDGFIRTYFNPSGGLAYFERQ